MLGALAAAGEVQHIAFPTARWFFEASREVPWLHVDIGERRGFPVVRLAERGAAWCSGGLAMVVRSFTRGPRNPVTIRRIRRFREIKRGYYSLLILLRLGGLAALDQVVVGKRALAVQYDGKWSFPAFLPTRFEEQGFRRHRRIGRSPGELLAKLGNALPRQCRQTARVILPPVPYDPTGDTLPPRSRPLVQREGSLSRIRRRKPYSGLAREILRHRRGQDAPPLHPAQRPSVRPRRRLERGRHAGLQRGIPRREPVSDRYNGDGHQGGLPRPDTAATCAR